MKDALTGQYWFGIFRKEKLMASCRIPQPRAPNSVRVLPERTPWGPFFHLYVRARLLSSLEVSTTTEKFKRTIVLTPQKRN